MGKVYKLYVSDPVLIEICDELVHDTELSPTINRLMLNGLGKDLGNTKEQLKKRITRVSKLDKQYKRLKNMRVERHEKAYTDYCSYRNNCLGFYDHKSGLVWIENKSKQLGIEKETLLDEFEERYKTEDKK